MASGAATAVRRGWTTGACAAAARAAFTAMLTSRFPDPVSIRLRGRDAGDILVLAGGKREALARGVAARAREVALATLSGRTAVEGAIFDRPGDPLARAGG